MDTQTLDRLFELLIAARNSQDEEALQDAIDLVASALSTQENRTHDRQSGGSRIDDYLDARN